MCVCASVCKNVVYTDVYSIHGYGCFLAAAESLDAGIPCICAGLRCISGSCQPFAIRSFQMDS